MFKSVAAVAEFTLRMDWSDDKSGYGVAPQRKEPKWVQ